MAKVTIDTRSATQLFAKSITDLQEAKGYTSGESLMFLAGYLESHLVSIIDQLPKAKRLEVLASMARETLRKEAQAEVLQDQKAS
jgi:hypothetical protein